MENKTCTKCGEAKPLSAFRQKGGKPCSACADCEKAYSREYNSRPEVKARTSEYNKHYEKTAAGKAARSRSVVRLTQSGWMYEHGVRKHMLKKYGLTEFEYKKLVQRQDGRCAICNVEPNPYATHKRGLHIDHDHETGAVRGLLCGNCNAALGHFKDSIENLAQAIRYLVKSRAIQERDKEQQG